MAGTRKDRDGGGAGPGPFARIRRDHSRETAEDYAELVLQLEQGRGRGRVRPADLARRLGVSHVTVLRALERLVRAGVLRRDDRRGVALSAGGRRVARASRARHAVVAAFLERLGVTRKTAETDAEGIEHHVSQATLAAMKRFVARAQRSGRRTSQLGRGKR